MLLCEHVVLVDMNSKLYQALLPWKMQKFSVTDFLKHCCMCTRTLMNACRCSRMFFFFVRKLQNRKGFCTKTGVSPLQQTETKEENLLQNAAAPIISEQALVGYDLRFTKLYPNLLNRMQTAYLYNQIWILKLFPVLLLQTKEKHHVNSVMHDWFCKS